MLQQMLCPLWFEVALRFRECRSISLRLDGAWLQSSLKFTVLNVLCESLVKTLVSTLLVEEQEQADLPCC